jgi:trans-aconitate methyltransferase
VTAACADTNPKARLRDTLLTLWTGCRPRYRDAIAGPNGYPARDDGTVLLPFPRLFIVATRK